MKEENFTLGVDTYLQVVQFWQAYGHQLSQEELCDYICPLIAQTEAEQKHFRTVFKQYAHLLETLPQSKVSASTLTEEAVEDSEAGEGEVRPKLWRYLLVGGGMALLLIGIGWFFFPPEDVMDCMDPDAINYNPAATVACEDCCQLDTLSKELVTGCIDPEAINYNPAATVACDTCCQYVGCMDPDAQNYNPRATIACEDCCTYKEEEATTRTKDTVSFKPLFDYKPLDVITLQPIETNWLTYWADHKGWINGLLSLLILAIGLAWYLFKRRNRDYIARKESGEEPPYQLPIKIQTDQPIRLVQDFYVALNRLKGREATDQSFLSIPRTIAATSKNGGYIDFRFQFRKAPVEYLVLIDKHTDQNHQAQLFEYLYQNFVKNEVIATRFFFDGNPSHCWNDEYPDGLNLSRLVQLYDRHRLLILSDGHSFIDPTRGGLEKWTEQLREWPKRALLTPHPMADWSYREAILAQAVMVMPSNVQGMLELINHFEELPTPSLRDWKYQLGKLDQLVEVDEENVVESLARYYSPAMIRWMAACAVYPELHWDLSLELGRVLSTNEEPLLTFPNVASLARLPWFQAGEMPQEVREQLLQNEQLTSEDRLAVRAAIVRILKENVPKNTNSFAFEEYQMHLAINELLANKMGPDRKKWLELYREQYGKGIPEDYIAAAELDKQFNQLLDFKLPDFLNALFFEKGRGVLGWKDWWPMFISLFLILGLWLGTFFLPMNCGGERVQLPFGDEVYCVSTLDEWVDFEKLRARQLIDSARVEEALAHFQDINYWLSWSEKLNSGSLALYDYNQSEDLPGAIEFWRAVQLDTTSYSIISRMVFEDAIDVIYNEGLRAYRAENYTQLFEQLAVDSVLKWCASFNDSVYTGDKYELMDRGKSLNHLAAFTSFWGGDTLSARRYNNQFRVTDLLELDSTRLYTSKTSVAYVLQYDFVDSTINGFTRIRDGDRYGYISATTGQLLRGGLVFSDAYNFQNDTALVVLDSKQAFIDTTGKVIQFFNRLVPFQGANGRWGYETELGLDVIAAQFEEAAPFTTEAIARVKIDGFYRYIDFRGNYINNERYLEAQDFSEGLAAAKERGDNQWVYINTAGQIHQAGRLEYRGFASASPFKGGRANITIDQENFYELEIDQDGECRGEGCGIQELIVELVDRTNSLPLKKLGIYFNNERIGTVGGPNNQLTYFFVYFPWEADLGEAFRLQVRDLDGTALIDTLGTINGFEENKPFILSLGEDGSIDNEEDQYVHEVANTMLDAWIFALFQGEPNINPLEAYKLKSSTNIAVLQKPSGRITNTYPDEYFASLFGAIPMKFDFPVVDSVPLMIERSSSLTYTVKPRDRFLYTGSFVSDRTTQFELLEFKIQFDRKDPSGKLVDPYFREIRIVQVNEEEPAIPVPPVVLVEGGTFTMGCEGEIRDGDCDENEKPAHQVSVSTFYMGKFEVTNLEFVAFLNDQGNQEEGGVKWYDDYSSYSMIEYNYELKAYEVNKEFLKHPVVDVSWYGAMAYCKWLSKKTGQGFRLPTETEWEYAARGGNKSKGYLYSGSNSLSKVAWWESNSKGYNMPVGQLFPNELGIYDLSGNVREWCIDIWYDNYMNRDKQIIFQKKEGEVDQSAKVTRGESWTMNIPNHFRISARFPSKPDRRIFNQGFRVIRSSNQKIGCTDPKATNYDPTATIDCDGCCDYDIPIPPIELVVGGTFTMGCESEQRDGACGEDEKPAHQVTIPTFYMGKYEVTNAEFAAFLNEQGNQEEGGVQWYNEGASPARIQTSGKGRSFEVEAGYEQYPVDYVSWYGARAYCKWLAEKTGRNYRLPTEAEWEYAARGGTESQGYLYAGSNQLVEVGWYRENSGRNSQKVGQLAANELGLYDMSGNLYEWCADWYRGEYYQECYDKGMIAGPRGPVEGDYRVLRGGGWGNDANMCRVAYRGGNEQDGRFNDFGFRLACSL